MARSALGKRPGTRTRTVLKLTATTLTFSGRWSRLSRFTARFSAFLWGERDNRPIRLSRRGKARNYLEHSFLARSAFGKWTATSIISAWMWIGLHAPFAQQAMSTTWSNPLCLSSVRLLPAAKICLRRNDDITSGIILGCVRRQESIGCQISSARTTA